MPARLGQHFLKRGSVLAKIAAAACPSRESLVIEIGAGRGALTKELLGRAERLVAIEADKALSERLRERFSAAENLTVIHADVLSVDLAQWGPAVVAGNLPYYITSPILRQTLELGALLKRAVFLVQKEVAQRLTAAPGSREYGLLTVITQLRADVRVLFSVPPAAFSPPPKVESAVVVLTPKPEQSGPMLSEPGFVEFLGRCFRQKRKTLRNNLKGAYERRLLDGMAAAGRRAEQQSIEELFELYQQLKSAKS